MDHQGPAGIRSFQLPANPASAKPDSGEERGATSRRTLMALVVNREATVLQGHSAIGRD